MYMEFTQEARFDRPKGISYMKQPIRITTEMFQAGVTGKIAYEEKNN